jgi:hypothetical protein
MLRDGNEALVGRLYDALWSSDDFDVADELVAESEIHHEHGGTALGEPEAQKQAARAAFPDAHFALEVVVTYAGNGPHLYRGDDGCEPPPLDLRPVAYIYSGQTVTRNICYAIASRDAGSLQMQGGYTIPIPQQSVWFALR